MTFKDIGIIGAGTMGSGIARFFAAQGITVRLFDSASDIAESAVEKIQKGFGRDVSRGRMTEDAAAKARDCLHAVSGYSGLVACDLVIEAVVENPDVKRTVYEELERTVAPDCVIATNTSSLSVTSLAAVCHHPSRFLGIHFFNPAHVMKFVEVVPGLQTQTALASGVETFLRGLGKSAHIARDTPGFIVNRVARPFYGEAFALVEAGIATPDAIDAVMRDAGRFRMGPFELTDFIGQDINTATTRSVWTAFAFDRWFMPSQWQEKLVEAGYLGKKTGQGVYSYDDEGNRTDSPGSPKSKAAPLKILFQPESGREEQAAALLGPILDHEGSIQLVWAEDKMPETLSTRGDILMIVTDQLDPASLISRYNLPPHATVTLSPMSLLRGGTCVVISEPRTLDPNVLDSLHATFARVGKSVHSISNARGHILPRIVALIINVAVDALDRGVASAEAIDEAMKLGTGYPDGPLAWADQWGLKRVLAVMDALFEHTHDERYRAAPGLRERAMLGLTFFPEIACRCALTPLP